MFRCAAILLVVYSVAGCRAPTPSFNVFAPYGSSRVPPPPTGTVPNPNAYYQVPAGQPPAVIPTQTPPSTPPSLGAPPMQPGTPPAFMGAMNQAAPAPMAPIQVEPTQTGPVVQASFQTTDLPQAPPASTEKTASQDAPGSDLQPMPVQAVTAGSPSSLSLRGMPVNDATQVQKPAAMPMPTTGAPNVPSDANRSPSFLRILSSPVAPQQETNR